MNAESTRWVTEVNKNGEDRGLKVLDFQAEEVARLINLPSQVMIEMAQMVATNCVWKGSPIRVAMGDGYAHVVPTDESELDAFAKQLEDDEIKFQIVFLTRSSRNIAMKDGQVVATMTDKGPYAQNWRELVLKTTPGMSDKPTTITVIEFKGGAVKGQEEYPSIQAFHESKPDPKVMDLLKKAAAAILNNMARGSRTLRVFIPGATRFTSAFEVASEGPAKGKYLLHFDNPRKPDATVSLTVQKVAVTAEGIEVLEQHFYPSIPHSRIGFQELGISEAVAPALDRCKKSRKDSEQRAADKGKDRDDENRRRRSTHTPRPTAQVIAGSGKQPEVFDTGDDEEDDLPTTLADSEEDGDDRREEE